MKKSNHNPTMNPFFLTTLALLILILPASTHAAYSFPQVHSYLQEPAYVTSASPSYSTPNYNPGGYGYFADPGNHQALCSTYATAAGYPDTTNMYCVFDGSIGCSPFGGSDLGSGSGGTLSGGTLCIYSGVMALYLTPPSVISTMSFSALAAQGFSPATPSVCRSTETYNFQTGTIGVSTTTNSNISCDVYHSTGAPQTPPTATLSASPSSVSAGNSSALTYTCAGGATSASIDNGVGAVSPTAGTVGVTPGVTTNYTLTCTNANGSGTAAATVTVTSALPDLTAGSAAPATATAGTPVTLSSTITNTGAGSTGASFTDLFQRATDASGTGSTDIGTYSSAVLATGGSNSATLSYTFPSAATWYVRACADKSSAASSGVISESNEANNCGAWTAVTVTAATPAPICTFTAYPTGSAPSTLTWSSTNATSCTGGGFSTGFGSPTSGSKSVATVGSYTLTCTGAGGSCTQSLSVGASCTGSPTGTLTATPNRIRTGVATSVTFSLPSIQNVKTSCTLSGTGIPTQTYAANACTVSATYTTTLTLSTQGVYTLTCDGVKASSALVNVLPNFTEF